jgi:hypothetical protein
MSDEPIPDKGDMKFFLLAALMGLAGGLALGYLLFHSAPVEPVTKHEWTAIPCKHCEEEAAKVAAESAALAERRPLHLATSEGDE